jgi:hypothetical protein
MKYRAGLSFGKAGTREEHQCPEPENQSFDGYEAAHGATYQECIFSQTQTGCEMDYCGIVLCDLSGLK